LADARAQLQLAELAGDGSPPAEIKAAVSSAVLAGIAACDAACSKALGRTNRSQNHRDAVELLGQVAPGGTDAAKQLERLLGLKDESQYGFTNLTGQKLQPAIPRAKSARSPRRRGRAPIGHVSRPRATLTPPRRSE
jgi:hypothetical protein